MKRYSEDWRGAKFDKQALMQSINILIIVIPLHKLIKKGGIKSIIDDLGITKEEFFKLI